MTVDELTELATSDDPGRPRGAVIALLTLAAFTGVIALILLAQRDDRPLAELRVRDDAVDVRSGEEDFRAAVEGEPLQAGDTVRTDSAGQAQIDFFDGSLTRLDTDTTLVIRGLRDDTPGGVLLTLEAGRTWNRVEPATTAEDRYEVKGVNGTASVVGTTFVSDCRQAPICYYLGIDGETEVTSALEDRFFLGAGDCVRAEESLMRRCSDHEREALTDDWVSENIAVDGGSIDTPTLAPLSPSISPSATPATTIRRAPTRRRTPVPARVTPTPRRTPRPTPTPKVTPKPKPSPSPTASPTPTPAPTASPTEPPPSATEPPETEDPGA